MSAKDGKRNRPMRRGSRGINSTEIAKDQLRERFVKQQTDDGCSKCGNQEIDHEGHCDECGYSPEVDI